MWTKYDKYHQKMKRLIAGKNFVGDKDFEEYKKYFKSRITKEEGFSLFQYSRFYKENETVKPLDLDNLYLSVNGKQNDIFEGIGDWSSINELDYDQKKQALKSIHDFYYMKCFSENYNNNLMWGHYADGHRGYCVEYDFANGEADSWIWDMFPVIYSSKRIQVFDFESTAYELREEIKEGYLEETKGLFLYKDSIWKYEKEWRYIVRKDLVDSASLVENRMFKIKAPRIKSIYLGAKIDDACKPKMADAIKRYVANNGYNIDIYQMLYDENTYVLYKHPITDKKFING